MNDLDVLLVGPYPPPFGGISAHVARLAEAAREHGLSVRVLNHFRTRDGDALVIGSLARNPWRYWHSLRSASARVVHYHHSRWSTLLAAALALRHSSAATVVTVHGRELEPFLCSRVPGVARLTRRALMVFDVLIAVSSEIEQSLSSLGPVKLIPAFIPTHNDEASLSPATRAFLRDGTNVVVAAYRLSVDRRGRMIYGLETAIRSFAAVARARSDLRLAIFLASAPSSRRQSDRLRLLIEGVDDEDVRRRIGVFCGEPLAPALPLAALYLRPTLTDGDAVSIREAIAAGVPVLASDVVVRPPGVRTVPLDTSRWAEAVEQALARREPAPLTGAAADPLDELLAIYDELRHRPSQAATEMLVP